MFSFICMYVFYSFGRDRWWIFFSQHSCSVTSWEFLMLFSIAKSWFLLLHDFASLNKTGASSFYDPCVMIETWCYAIWLGLSNILRLFMVVISPIILKLIGFSFFTSQRIPLTRYNTFCWVWISSLFSATSSSGKLVKLSRTIAWRLLS